MTDEQKAAALSLIEGICDVIRTAPNGFPAGALYAYLMDKLTLDQFNSLVRVLVATGKVKRAGNLLICK